MKTTQISYLLLSVLGIILMLHIFLLLNNFEKYGNALIISSILLLIVMLLFYKLDIQIDNKILTISFGIGLVNRSISIDSIESVKIVEISAISGWGIRYSPNYMLYNVGGFKAIELSFKDKSQNIRIGTKDPENLAKFILKLL